MTTQNRFIGPIPAKLISDYSKPVTWPEWRKGSRLNAIITSDIWWLDYVHCSTITSPHYACTARVAIYPNFSWYNWCFETLILGPPRQRTGREMNVLNEMYLSGEDYWRHHVPWKKTWPAPDDLSWCTGPHKTTLPDWVIDEYNDVHQTLPFAK